MASRPQDHKDLGTIRRGPVALAEGQIEDGEQLDGNEPPVCCLEAASNGASAWRGTGGVKMPKYDFYLSV
jgi:hypothetical protein